MGIKKLFTVPDGEKVTEKALRRVLISSVCSILLCMTCLVSTTWAWFAVSIENTKNVIQIGEPEVELKVNGNVVSSEATLHAGKNMVVITRVGDPDDLNRKSTLYVTLTIGETTTVYTFLSEAEQLSGAKQLSEDEQLSEDKQDTQDRIEIEIDADENDTLRWEASWFAPSNAVDVVELTGDSITLPANNTMDEDPESPEESSAGSSSESSADSSEESSTDSSSESSEESSADSSEESSADSSSESSADSSSESSEESSTGSSGESSAESASESSEPTPETPTTDLSSDPTSGSSSDPTPETSSTPTDVPGDAAGNDVGAGETDSTPITTEATTE